MIPQSRRHTALALKGKEEAAMTTGIKWVVGCTVEGVVAFVEVVLDMLAFALVLRQGRAALVQMQPSDASGMRS